MKKILLIILLIIFIIIGIILIKDGIRFGDFYIFSFKDITEKENKLKTKQEEILKLTEVDFIQKVNDLNTKFDELKKIKGEYDDKIMYSNTDEKDISIKLEEYELEFIYERLGRFATDKNLLLKLNYTNKNLNFELYGNYGNIIGFLYDLENDEDLKVKIENFKLIPKDLSSQTLQATFNINNINIKTDGYSSSINNNTENNEGNSNVQSNNHTEGNEDGTDNLNTDNNANTDSNTNTNTNTNTTTDSEMSIDTTEPDNTSDLL